MDEIRLTQKVYATNHEAPEFLDSDYDANNLYKVEKMSFEGTKENLDWHKCAFEDEKKNSYGIENRNDMMRIHNNDRGSIPAKVGFWVGLRIFSYARTPTKLTNEISKTQLLGPK